VIRSSPRRPEDVTGATEPSPAATRSTRRGRVPPAGGAGLPISETANRDRAHQRRTGHARRRRSTVQRRPRVERGRSTACRRRSAPTHGRRTQADAPSVGASPDRRCGRTVAAPDRPPTRTHSHPHEAPPSSKDLLPLIGRADSSSITEGTQAHSPLGSRRALAAPGRPRGRRPCCRVVAISRRVYGGPKPTRRLARWHSHGLFPSTGSPKRAWKP
jgi:hypothetical protein